MMTQNDNTTERDTHEKSTLFCLECEYEGEPPEYVPKINYGGMRTLVCPRCGAEIDKRPIQQSREFAETD